ncbi:YbaB/EbfC family nucleoid-associated protein [Corynebacterium kroppenstedtii]|uniref:YbaB/EbfC family nucleoid-associated protein n=1 Tax=Corynebacterium sp. PCR 32 TaxID=3351342 RepID=UPI0030B08D65
MSQPDFNEIMAQAQQMQEQLQRVQGEIAESEISGTAGNGLVTVTMKGTGEVTAVSIDKSVVDPDDVDTLQDLVLGALQDANSSLQSYAQEKMGPFSEGLGGLGV